MKQITFTFIVLVLLILFVLIFPLNVLQLPDQIILMVKNCLRHCCLESIVFI
ncbi:hypothetical protein OCL94_01680 [Macrococcus sp. TMW 2.2395]|nr:hypothetical protein [Macrococcus sp. TMW 2.2395]